MTPFLELNAARDPGLFRQPWFLPAAGYYRTYDRLK